MDTRWVAAVGLIIFPENEKPLATRGLRGRFWISKYEATQGQWKKIMGNHPSHFDRGDNYPVEQVSWNDCQEFID